MVKLWKYAIGDTIKVAAAGRNARSIAVRLLSDLANLNGVLIGPPEFDGLCLRSKNQPAFIFRSSVVGYTPGEYGKRAKEAHDARKRQ